jgi:hypothetical protein
MGRPAVVLAVLGLALLLQQALGHGVMVRPASRNWEAYLRENFNYAHGLAAGGAGSAAGLAAMPGFPDDTCSHWVSLVLQVLGRCLNNGPCSGPRAKRACAGMPGMRTGAATVTAVCDCCPTYIAWQCAVTPAPRLHTQTHLQQLQQQAAVLKRQTYSFDTPQASSHEASPWLCVMIAVLDCCDKFVCGVVAQVG